MRKTKTDLSGQFFFILTPEYSTDEETTVERPNYHSEMLQIV